MKKLIYSMFALAIMAMTFNSCEDVPAPYALPGDDDPVVIEPTGDGTLENPFNVAAIINITQDLGTGEVSNQDYYFKGKVVSIRENYDYVNDKGQSYGNATFYISDDGTPNGQFCVYRTKYLGNKTWKKGAGALLAVGDEVIICGKVTNYNGTTPETDANNSFLYSLNGVTEGGGDDIPTAIEINCAKAVELTTALADNATSTEVYAVTGYITEVVGNVSRNQQTFWMADTKDGQNTFEAYYADLPDGVSEFKKGMKVKITGNLLKYVKDGNMTPEIKNAKVEILENAGGSETKVVGSIDNPITSAKALEVITALSDNATTEEFYYVSGKVTRKANTADEIGPNSSKKYKDMNYFISDNGSQQNELYVYRGKFLNGADFTDFEQLKEGDEVVIYGQLQKYIDAKNDNAVVAEAKNSKIVKLNGKTEDGGSGDEGDDTTYPTSGDNGSFESWADGVPTNWKTASTAGNAKLAQSTEAHGGSYSVKVSGDTGANKRIGYKELSLKKGNYTVVFYAKALAEGGSLNPGFVPIKADGSAGTYKYSGYVDNVSTSEWQKVEATLEIPSDGVYCIVVMNQKKSSAVDILIDDFTVTLGSTTIIK